MSDGAPAGPPADTSSLEQLIARLQDAAGRLRSGALGAEDAARLVDDAARIASEASGELERLARAAASEPLPGQDRLL